MGSFDDVTRRRFLGGLAVGGAALGFQALRAPVDAEAARGPQIYGVGHIRDHIPETLPSPSDFGFTAHADGGTFVCSMFGSLTGGFRGCDIMTVQGTVAPGTLTIKGKTAKFEGKVGVFMYPNIFSPGDTLPLNAGNLTFNVTATFGGPGKATMILEIPAVTAMVGGNTGGIVQFGRIERRKVSQKTA